jgi:MerR family mercuric resistance operon transcriptional regulator
MSCEPEAASGSLKSAMTSRLHANTSFSIGALAQRTGVSVDNIRYYERVRLLAAPSRTPGGQRRYLNEHVQSLLFIRRARALGFSLKDVRSLFDVRAMGKGGCEKAKAIALRHLHQMREKMAALRQLEQELIAITDRCNPGNQPTCPIIDALDDPPPDAIIADSHPA